MTGVAAGTPLAALLLRRHGARGRLWFSATVLAFFGLALTLMMGAHTVEVIYNTLHGGQTVEGSPWAYNFRTYSLLLLAAVLLFQAVRALRMAPRLARGERFARRRAMGAAGIVLAVCAPLIPVQAFFGVMWTAISAVTLLVIVTTETSN